MSSKSFLNGNQEVILTIRPAFFISSALKCICWMVTQWISESYPVVNWLGIDRIKRNVVGNSLGIPVDRLNMNHHGTLTAVKAYCIVQRWREVFFSFCSALLQVLCPIWCSAKGCMTWNVQLAEVSLFGLKERRPWEDLATGLNYHWDITEHTEPETSQRYTVKRSKLWKGKFQLDCEKLFYFVPSSVI